MTIGQGASHFQLPPPPPPHTHLDASHIKKPYIRRDVLEIQPMDLLLFIKVAISTHPFLPHSPVTMQETGRMLAEERCVAGC